jgi:hypothetical protein
MRHAGKGSGTGTKPYQARVSGHDPGFLIQSIQQRQHFFVMPSMQLFVTEEDLIFHGQG